MYRYKLILCTILVFASQMVSIAQETAFGKKLAEDFWKALEEKRFVAAKGKLESLKRREPNFDASKMEKALNEATTRREEQVSSVRASRLAGAKAGNLLDELFRSRVIQSSSSDTAEKINSDIEKYAKMTEEVLAVDRNSIASDLEKTLESLRSDLVPNDEKNAGLVKSVNESDDAKHAETAYYELLLRQSYWDNARKIFPDERDLVRAYDSIAASIRSLGTEEQRAERAKKNMNARIDEERVPKAAVKDANLERAFQNAFLSQSKAQGWNYTLLRVSITTDDYLIVRHNVTGIILGRRRIGAVAFKDKDGKCKQGIYRITQDYVGGSFTDSWRGDFGDFTHEMRCENVNK